MCVRGGPTVAPPWWWPAPALAKSNQRAAVAVMTSLAAFSWRLDSVSRGFVRSVRDDLFALRGSASGGEGVNLGVRQLTLDGLTGFGMTTCSFVPPFPYV